MSDNDKNECWSLNGEDNWQDIELSEFFSNHEGDIEVGQKIYVGEAEYPKPHQLFDTDDIVDLISERAYEIGGEFAEDFPDVKKEAIDELHEFLEKWIEKHCEINFYKVKNVREYVLTQDDLSE
jgi:hypothetical protein